MLSLFPRGVLDEILNLIESVFEGFLTYSSSDLLYPDFVLIRNGLKANVYLSKMQMPLCAK